MTDIFNAQKSVIASGLEGKIILIYGSNSLGKTYQATRFKKPLVLMAESGLNGIDGIPFIPINNWSDFKIVVNQLTNSATKDKAKEMYSTIIVDEIYATSIYAQDYTCSVYGDGALTLADAVDSKHNLYQAYEKEYFRQINLLTSAGFTIVFIGHQQIDSKTGYISPKGDKRCISPIVDRCDYVVYLTSNGVDAEGNVIKSSAFLAETNRFFARSRISYTPTFIQEFTAENLEKAIQEGIDKKRELDNSKVVTFSEQQKVNKTENLNFEELINEFNSLLSSIDGYKDITGTTEEGIEFQSYWAPRIGQIVENNLGKGKKISQCTSNQAEALKIINQQVKELLSKG